MASAGCGGCLTAAAPRPQQRSLPSTRPRAAAPRPTPHSPRPSPRRPLRTAAPHQELAVLEERFRSRVLLDEKKENAHRPHRHHRPRRTVSEDNTSEVSVGLRTLLARKLACRPGDTPRRAPRLLLRRPTIPHPLLAPRPSPFATSHPAPPSLLSLSSLSFPRTRTRPT